MNRCAVSLLLAGIALFSAPARAQQATANLSADEVKRQLDELRVQMANQTRLINALQARLEEIQKEKPPATITATAAAADQQSSTPPPVSTQQVGETTTNYVTVALDPEAAPRIDNAPLDPKYPGFFRIPGTQTFLKVGGYFKTDFIYDGKPAGDVERFIPSSIPVGRPGVNNTTMSVRPTRMNLDFRVPVKALGDVRFYVEADLFGSNSTTPRLRHAYTQAKNFLIGQTFSNFQDPDAGPDGLDFQGPNSQVSIRNPQLRYTLALAKKTSFAFSVEKASSDVAFKTPEFSALPNSPGPDGTVKFRQEYTGGHIQVAGLFRAVAAYLPNGNSDSVFGWGVMMAGAQKVVGKDTFTYQVAYGRGMERYLNDTSGLGIDAAVVSTYQPYLRALPVVAPYFGYQHYWVNKVRSNVIYGFAQVSNTAYQSASAYHKSNYMSGNLIWNVFGTLNVGGEFLYGWVKYKDNSSANAPRIMFSAKYDLNFAKKAD
ncbi:MAG: DcaP family trimeric outer membrane transporter [Candidatus Solibacter sp.]